MKNSIELKKGEFIVNGKPFFIFSGEIHYFRIPRREWEDRIKKAKDVGLNTFSSYIPWIWHEPKEGQFDFTGKTRPERDSAMLWKAPHAMAAMSLAPLT